MLKLFGNLGIYQGMLEFFSEAGIKLALLIVLLLLFFMVFAALKLISDTILELSLFFFSKESPEQCKKGVCHLCDWRCLFIVQRSIHLRAWVDLYRDECRG
ncbi:DUF5366 family protein [Peribacillus frigoritolerans]|uniref:DUF5366 family protein n=1 Tax=Peribacillus frigoritolerans TaxID=450367 RepID=UPI0039A193EC